MYTLADLIRSEDIGKYDALILIGQHAQEGTKDGFIAHTNSGHTALRLNGKPTGEIGQAVWLAGHFGVSTILVSGDYAATREANHYFPDITTVSVKKKVDEKFVCFPVEDVLKELEEKAFEQIKNLEKIERYVLSGPISVDILYSFPKLAESMTIIPGYEKKDKRTVVYEADNYLEAFWAYHGFRVVLNEFSKDFYKNIATRVEMEFNLKDNEKYKKWRKEIVKEFYKDKLGFPEIKY
jgi:D-aminopeptidase